MPPLDYEHPVITATQSLATGHLRVSLLVEASLAHPSFLSESPLSDLRENAMETLPAVLAKEAPPVLRQILQAVEAQLLSRTSQDVASTVPFVMEMAGVPEATLEIEKHFNEIKAAFANLRPASVPRDPWPKNSHSTPE